MAARQLTAEEFASWLTPSRAVEILKAKYQGAHLAKETLLGRLSAGVAQGGCRKVVINDQGRISSGELLCLGVSDWARVRTDDNFWITGDLIRSSRTSTFDSTITSCFDVRFEPDGINSIIAPLLAPGPTAKSESVDDEAATKGPPVSPEALKAWFDVYRKVYGGSAEDTLDNALKSARGMFPGRFVSRDRVRELAGGRAPGRKARNDG